MNLNLDWKAFTEMNVRFSDANYLFYVFKQIHELLTSLTIVNSDTIILCIVPCSIVNHLNSDLESFNTIICITY